MYEIDCVEMGKRIYEKRKALGYTQEKVANKVEIGTTHFGQIERGENKCSLRVITNIAMVLKADLDALVRGVDEYNADVALTQIVNKVPRAKREKFVEMCDSMAELLK